ncbi:MAG: putative zinc-binding metallopeptidase [Planctomycetes bacterium]|nr:putative zinc-binding metallopeptidase [Planctomycetota bacterium]
MAGERGTQKHDAAPERPEATHVVSTAGDRGAEPFESAGEEAIPLEILSRRVCDFDLQIEGRPLGAIVERFRRELADRGLTRLHPRFYLSDEWGVPEDTVAIGIPFYLADKRLLKVQKVKGGMVEGVGEEDILRYLRHEMGHVVNYAYRLYATQEWTLRFGPMARPYTQEYRSVPFSPEFVRHLPGAYAQKHPDEDWAETFAVWLTPGSNWRELHVDAPGALAKLEYCERTMASVRERDPDVTSTDLDVDAREIRRTLQEYYDDVQVGETTIPRSLDGDLRGIFAARPEEAFAGATGGAAEDATAGAATTTTATGPGTTPTEGGAAHLPRAGSAAALLRRQRDPLATTVYRWTGVDSDLLRQLVAHLQKRAQELKLTYPLGQRDAVLGELTAFVTTLAMNYVYKGNFFAR